MTKPKRVHPCLIILALAFVAWVMIALFVLAMLVPAV